MIWVARILCSFWNSYDDNQLQRYFHTSAIINKQHMYIYGGVVKSEGQQFTNSFVVYNLESGEYHSLNDNIKVMRRKKTLSTSKSTSSIRSSSYKPEKLLAQDLEVFANAKLPKLAQHTMTSISKHILYIYGGQTEKGAASNSLYRFNIESMEWVKVRCSSCHTLESSLPALYG